MEMGLAANERGGQTASCMRTQEFSDVILGTCCRRICKNLENLIHMWPRIHVQTRYGHGG
jgi:hypothetical protein